MDEKLCALMLALLRSALFGDTLTDDKKAFFSDDVAKALFEVAKKHDVIHLIAKALCDNGIITKDHPYFPACQKAQVMAVYRYEQLNFELEQVSALFEKTQIPFMPLKGSVLRAFYPEPWMRTSCDIDVLIHPEDLEKATELLKTELNYTEALKTSCDIAFNAPSGRHVELHFNLISENYANDAHLLLENVWDYASLKEGQNYHYVLSDEMFYFYNIAHMSKHFENGGCGIRPFLDLWVLDNMPGVSKADRDELLKKGKLYDFAEGARLLSNVWFGGGQHNELTSIMEAYLLHGGAFGTMANKVTVQQQKKGGKKGYALSRIFPNLKFMRNAFPYVDKCVILLPFAYIHRFFQVLFRGNAVKSMQELKANSTVSEQTSDSAKLMLEKLGLL